MQALEQKTKSTQVQEKNQSLFLFRWEKGLLGGGSGQSLGRYLFWGGVLLGGGLE